MTLRAARGRAAEAVAEQFVRDLGLDVIGRNLRFGSLELDLVARDGAVVVVVEVRTRGKGAWAGALDSVDHKKQARLRRAAELLWVKQASRWPGIERLRFDVASVDLDAEGGPRVEYIRAAFT